MAVSRRFEAAALRFEEVLSCHLLSGDADYMLRTLTGLFVDRIIPMIAGSSLYASSV